MLCAPADADVDPYLRILRWMLEPDEELRFLGVGKDAQAQGKVAALVGATKDKITSTLDKEPAQLLVVGTDRRVLSTDTHAFLKRAEFLYDDGLETVRYVRSRPVQGEAKARRVDLITKDRNHEWQFGSEVEAGEVDALAAILAEAMDLPEHEREDLQSRRRPAKELANAPSA